MSALNIGNNSLGGTLPPAWGYMTALQDLRIMANQLTGQLPPEWAALSSLNTLEL